METLTQKSHRRGNAHCAIAMLKVAIIKACHEKMWRGGTFSGIKYPSSDVDIDLERLEESVRSTPAEKAIYQDTRRRVAQVRAYLEGRPTDLSSVDDLGWVQTLKNVFESQTGQGKEAGKASTAQKGEPSAKPALMEKVDDDGFIRQKVYGGSGGLRKD